MLDAKIPTVVKKIFENSNSKKKVYLEEQKAQTDYRCLLERKSAHMVYKQKRFTGTNETILENNAFMSVTLRGDDVQGFDKQSDEVLLSMREAPKNDTLESMYRQKL